jgi:putative sterol carrier protein
MDRGTVAVSRRQGRADCVIRADREVFEKLVTGQLNMLTAALRGLFRMEGDNVELLVLFQRYVGSRRHALATGRAGGGSDD